MTMCSLLRDHLEYLLPSLIQIQRAMIAEAHRTTASTALETAQAYFIAIVDHKILKIINLYFAI